MRNSNISPRTSFSRPLHAYRKSSQHELAVVVPLFLLGGDVNRYTPRDETPRLRPDRTPRETRLQPLRRPTLPHLRPRAPLSRNPRQPHPSPRRQSPRSLPQLLRTLHPNRPLQTQPHTRRAPILRRTRTRPRTPPPQLRRHNQHPPHRPLPAHHVLPPSLRPRLLLPVPGREIQLPVPLRAIGGVQRAVGGFLVLYEDSDYGAGGGEGGGG